MGFPSARGSPINSSNLQIIFRVAPANDRYMIATRGENLVGTIDQLSTTSNGIDLGYIHMCICMDGVVYVCNVM
jgi:hypothetical protein